MKSRHSKVVQKAAGKPLVCWVRDALYDAGADEQVYIVGHRQEEVRAALGEEVAFVLQEQQLGTGHAVMQASHFLEGRMGCTLVLCGDAPLITSDTLKNVLQQFESSSCAAIVISADAPDPTGYGRVVRDGQGDVQSIVEHRDATPEQREITEVNASMYCFDTPLLLSALGKIGAKNQQQEYYLTDTIEILIQEGHRVEAHKAPFNEIMGVNDRIQLQEAASVLNQRIVRRHMLNGVTIIDPSTTYIEDQVQIGMDSVIHPMTVLQGQTQVGEEAVIGPNSRLTDTIAGDRCRVEQSVTESCVIEEDCVVGPFSRIRFGSRIGAGCLIGNFVEIKNSTLGAQSQVVHQGYLGDVDVGENVNFGSNFSIANYDGQVKARTRIGSHAFIGTNTTLVAPVEVSENTYVAAGSTITEPVPQFALSIARARQINKENWVILRNRLREIRKNP